MTIADHSLVEGALRLYRERASRVRTLRVPPSVQQENFEPWYVGPYPEDKFWPAYHGYLREKRQWSKEALSSLDGASTKALALLPPPGAGVVSARGLVVGYVQSGKTSHFTALISKAADVGYRLFIVLSGVTDALRNQTQERLDREVADLNSEHWFKLTNYGEDFQQHSNVNVVLTQQAHLRAIAVVKKNAMRLRRLRDWLRGARPEVLRNCPILMIDDEADQASVNSARDPERRTIINQLLVELLRAHQQRIVLRARRTQQIARLRPFAPPPRALAPTAARSRPAPDPPTPSAEGGSARPGSLRPRVGVDRDPSSRPGVADALKAG